MAKLLTQANIQGAVKNQLATCPAWTCKAIVRLFERQTASEKTTGVTAELNGIGFSGRDSEILSSFAQQILAGRTLSAKQMTIAFRLVPRYWKQIASLIPQEKLEPVVSSYVINQTAGQTAN